MSVAQTETTTRKSRPKSWLNIVKGFTKFGEIVQGVLPGGLPFFVSGTLTSAPTTDSAYYDARRVFEVVGKRGRCVDKARTAAEALLKQHGVDPAAARGHITIDSLTAPGKGLGSSSIDIVLAMTATARSNDLPLHPRDIYRLMVTKVERSDAVFLPEHRVVCYPTTGDLQVLDLPQVRALIIGVDTMPDGGVDTAAAGVLDQQRLAHCDEYRDLLNVVIDPDSTPADILAAATRSSVLNNQWLRKPGFDAVMKLAAAHGGGVISAHTGTYLGIMLDPAAELIAVGRIQAALRDLGFKPELFQMGQKK